MKKNDSKREIFINMRVSYNKLLSNKITHIYICMYGGEINVTIHKSCFTSTFSRKECN